MSTKLPSRTPAADAAVLDAQQLAALVQRQAQQIDALQHQLDWFKRQLFGRKSERFVPASDPQQMHLGQLLGDVPATPAAEEPASEVGSHKRRKPRSDFADDGTRGSFFDESRVPVHTIELANPEAQALAPWQYEVIGEKLSYRLAQRPGAYVVLKYVRPVIKRLDTLTLHCPSAPEGVIDGSRADVSFLAGLVLDKFAWHIPLYRQHQRLLDAGFKLSRGWLTQLVQQAAQLLQPIYETQFDSIRLSRVKAMDETPIKAGRAGVGKMRAGYFWPVYGELDEVCFPYFESRRHEHVQEALGLCNVPGAVLLVRRV
jgi:Transposase and inactivated derivatives